MDYLEPVSKRRRFVGNYKNARSKRMLDMLSLHEHENNSTETELPGNLDKKSQCDNVMDNTGVIDTSHINQDHRAKPADQGEASGSKDNSYFESTSINNSREHENASIAPSASERVAVTIEDSDSEIVEPFSPCLSSEYIPDTDTDSTTDGLEDIIVQNNLKQTPTSKAKEMKEINTPDSFKEILTAVLSECDRSHLIKQSVNTKRSKLSAALTSSKLPTEKNNQPSRDCTSFASPPEDNNPNNDTPTIYQHQLVSLNQDIQSHEKNVHNQDINKNNLDCGSNTTTEHLNLNNDESTPNQPQSVPPDYDVLSIHSEQPELQSHEMLLHEIRENRPDFDSTTISTSVDSNILQNLATTTTLSHSGTENEQNLNEPAENVSSISINNINPEEQPEMTRTRKRMRHENNWEVNKSKVLKNLGKKYQSRTSKIERRERKMGNPCKCRMKCGEKINETERLSAFEFYWKLGCHTRQWDYILRLVSSKPKRVQLVISSRSRTQTLVYTLPKSDGVYVNVCKSMFLQTFDIHEKVVYTALEKMETNSVQDLRGTHVTRPNKVAEITTESVVEHINLFPRKESHYLRKQTQREYLDEKLNRSIMYRLYVAWVKDNPIYANIRPATERWYSYIFNTKFNIGFFQPKKDLCGLCTLYEQADTERKTQLEEDYVAHIKNKEIIRKIKDDEKVSSDPLTKTVACFDLEKVLSLPQSEVGVFHYKRKYPVYNFTVYNILTKCGYCYVWHAQIAKRGANEIASCLWSFLQSEAERGIKEISFYSDNCTGQNRNRFVFALYSYASRVLEIKITHRFLQKGHTQNEGDTMHSCIERFKKKQVLYVPDEMYSVIRNSKVHAPKFQVKEMTQDDFFDIKQLVDTSKNWEKDSSGNKVLWTKIREISVDLSAPAIFHIKYDFQAEETICLETNIARVGRRKKASAGIPTDNLATLTRLYDGPLPISQNLYKDLMSLCRDNYIPVHYHAFYKNLRPQSSVQELHSDIENSD